MRSRQLAPHQDAHSSERGHDNRKSGMSQPSPPARVAGRLAAVSRPAHRGFRSESRPQPQPRISSAAALCPNGMAVPKPSTIRDPAAAGSWGSLRGSRQSSLAGSAPMQPKRCLERLRRRVRSHRPQSHTCPDQPWCRPKPVRPRGSRRPVRAGASARREDALTDAEAGRARAGDEAFCVGVLVDPALPPVGRAPRPDRVRGSARR